MKKTYLKTYLKFLQKLASAVVKKYNPKIVVVTGTMGKTSTKDAVSHVLQSTFKTYKTINNSNNEFGVAQTILGINPRWSKFKKIFNLLAIQFKLTFGLKMEYPEVLILEAGTRKPGDIKNTIGYLKIDIVIITKTAEVPSHIEFFKDLNDLANEEFSSINFLKNGGHIVCFEADKSMLDLHQSTINDLNISVDYVSSAIEYGYLYDKKDSLVGTTAKFEIADEIFDVTSRGSASKANFYATLFAIRVAKHLNVKPNVIIDRIGSIKPTNGRSRIIKGVNGSNIIDDSYNASPDSVKIALENLAPIRANKKIVVLGEMLELGGHAEKSHLEILQLALNIADEIYLIGDLFIKSADSFKNNEKIKGCFSSPREIGDILYKNLSKNDLVLVKGSQGNRLDVTVLMLARDSKSVEQDLVRQNDYWKNKYSVVFATDYVPLYDKKITDVWKQEGFRNREDAGFWRTRCCGISCAQMVGEALTGEKTQLGKLIHEAFKSGAHLKNVGWIHLDLAKFISKRFGLMAKPHRFVSMSHIKHSIMNGHLVIASVGSTFMNSDSTERKGHLALIVGCEIKNGHIIGLYFNNRSSHEPYRMKRGYVPVKTFQNSFSGNIIEVGR
jgi:UDP-N-acetylmuramoyl-tripeptide--D-alanyl-D-alanine ligase